jgi:hypothetical protein
MFLFFIYYFLLNLLPTRHIYFKIHTEYCITNFNNLKWMDRTLNTTEINSDFYKLQQDYNSLNELFQTIITKNQINEIILTTLINNSLLL